MAERIFVYELKIPQRGNFLLVSKNEAINMDDAMSYLRGLFDNDRITITEISNALVTYKEITIENVWRSEGDDRPFIYKWSRSGVAVLMGYWHNPEEKKTIRENFGKLFSS